MADSSHGEAMSAHEQMAAKRGYVFPEFEWLVKKDPAYEQARNAYTAMIYTRENPALPVKYRELIAAVVLAFRGHPTIGSHLRRARREGASMQEIIEAFEVATVPGGMPVLHFALPFMIEVDKEIPEK